MTYLYIKKYSTADEISDDTTYKCKYLISNIKLITIR